MREPKQQESMVSQHQCVRVYECVFSNLRGKKMLVIVTEILVKNI